MAIIFDGDDTLWKTEPLYDGALSMAADYVTHLGLDGALWVQVQREFDLQNVATMGFSTKRFPASCVQAYRALAERTGGIASVVSEKKILEIAGAVFTQPAELVP